MTPAVGQLSGQGEQDHSVDFGVGCVAASQPGMVGVNLLHQTVASTSQG